MANRSEDQDPQVSDQLLAAAQDAQAHRERYQRSGAMAELEEALARWDALLAYPDTASAPSDFRASVLNETGMALGLRFQAAGREADLNRALDLWQQAVATTPADSPNRCNRTNNLGSGLMRRYEHSHHVEDLVNALERFRSALAVAPPEGPTRRNVLYNLGEALLMRYEAQGEIGLLEEAATRFREALASPPEETQEHVAFLDGLTDGLRKLYDRTHRVQDLEEILISARQALRLRQPEPTEQAVRLALLSGDLRKMYQCRGRFEDLEAAIVCLRRAVELMARDSPPDPGMLGNLALLLQARYGHTRRPEDLDEAVRLLRETTDLNEANPEDQAARMSNLASALVARYQRTGQAQDLEESLSLYREALTRAPEASQEYWAHLNSLAFGLGELYRRNGRMEVLDEVVALSQKALSLLPEGSGQRVRPLINLAGALKDRSLRTGRLEELDEALHAWKEAIQLEPQDLWERQSLLGNLGTGLRTRFAWSAKIEDIDDAVTLLRQAVSLTPARSPERPWRLGNLANALGDRYGVTRQIKDLEDSLAAYREAIDATPLDTPGRPTLLSNMGISLRDLYKRGNRLEDLDEAIRLIRQSLEGIPQDSSERAVALLNLASGLRDRYTRLTKPEDLADAQAAYREAAVLGADFLPEVVVITARAWSAWALERESFEEAAGAAAYGLAEVEKLLKRQHQRRHQEDWLMTAYGLSANAAYALARAGDLTRAVETLEGGRAHLLAEALESHRHDLERLALLGRGALLEQYRKASSEWELLTALRQQRQEAVSTGASAPAVSRKQLEACRAQLDEIIEEVRRVPGYENFLTAPTFSQIQAAAAPSPLVYIFTTCVGGLALVVHGDARKPQTPPVEAIPLPHLTEPAIREKLFGKLGADSLGGYLSAYAYRVPDDQATFVQWTNALDEIAHWLWDSVMGPIVEALAGPLPPTNTLERTPTPKAVLIPTGLLSLLPLHAAWRSDPASPSGRHYALDDGNWCYAPNARALNAARSRLNDLSGDSLLLVVDPRPVSADSLPFARDEARTIIQLWPETSRISRWHRAATHEQVSTLLPAYRVLHYAGHAFAGWDKPQEGGLLLADDRVLAVRELQAMHLNMRLAVLSACETGVPGVYIPDEVIGLPTALVEAGVAGVVASLWSVPDDTTAKLMADFYGLWRRKEEGLEPCEALRVAQLALRDGGHAHPCYWAAFTYSGV